MYGISLQQEISIDGEDNDQKASEANLGDDSYQFLVDKDGIVKREVLTKNWTDWIDYWAVDFDFEPP